MAPKLSPGTHMHVRETSRGVEARTDASKWHRVLQWWGGHHLDREADGEWRDNGGWRGQRRRPSRHDKVRGSTRADRRADLALGKHAQNLREEAATHGGKEERAMFYGTGREHRGAGVERRTRTTAADRDQDPDERVRRTFAVTYRDDAGTHVARTLAYDAAGARQKIGKRGTVVKVTRAL